MIDWFLRYIKGFFIGTGFILPGVSGGALAAVFGVYERIISFLAHITRDFIKNVLFFIPLGLGALTSIFFLSFALSFFLDAYETFILWFFIGCILGTVPALWRQAGKEGRKPGHIVLLLVAFFISLLFLLFIQKKIGSQVPQNLLTWLLAGGLIGLGVVIPGLSPSNFLVFMGMYKAMTDGIKTGNLGVILPVLAGFALCVLSFSRLMDYVFTRAYTVLFHLILGIVFASTVLIIPLNYEYLSAGSLVCFGSCVAGVALGWWMSSLEKKYKTS